MSHWVQIAAVAGGGAVGAVLRFLINSGVIKVMPKFVPAGTLAVNVLGCLVIGVLVVVLEPRDTSRELWRAVLVTGLLGSLTTFSTFGYQTVELAREGTVGLAIGNVVLNLAFGLPAVLLGLWLGQRLVGP